jgi:hypothetical protein
MKKFLLNIAIIFIASASLFSQEYEIAWEKDIGGSYAQFSKDGEFIYVAGGNTISKYRSIDGSFVSTFDNSCFKQNGSDFYGNFYLSNSGNYLIGVCGQYYNVWDTKKENAFFQFNDIYGGLDINNEDSKYIAVKRITPDNDRITILDFLTQKELKSVTTNQNVILTKLSHNGKMFATASKSGPKNYLTLWNTETLTEIKRFELEGDEFTTFTELKFSLDDIYVGVSSLGPHKATIIDITQLKEYYNSTMVSNLGIGRFGFLNKHFIFNYNNFNTSDYNVYFVNNQSLKFEQNLKTISSSMTTSSNGLIFTKYSLLRPKTVGVNEAIQQIISISNNKDLIIIDNKSGINENTDITLFDLQGKEVFRFLLFINYGTNKLAIPKNILNGSYIIQITSKNLNISQKILIQI